jgi:hypothetical protein
MVGATALVSSARVVLAGGNDVTLSQELDSIVALRLAVVADGLEEIQSPVNPINGTPRETFRLLSKPPAAYSSVNRRCDGA